MTDLINKYHELKQQRDAAVDEALKQFSEAIKVGQEFDALCRQISQHYWALAAKAIDDNGGWIDGGMAVSLNENLIRTRRQELLSSLGIWPLDRVITDQSEASQSCLVALGEYLQLSPLWPQKEQAQFIMSPGVTTVWE